jgi:hypothetical protein
LLSDWHDSFGWNAGGGATLSLGHKRELFFEARAINFMKSGFENAAAPADPRRQLVLV